MWLLILYILSAGHKDQVIIDHIDTFAQCGAEVDKLIATNLLNGPRIKLSCEQSKPGFDSTNIIHPDHVHEDSLLDRGFLSNTSHCNIHLDGKCFESETKGPFCTVSGSEFDCKVTRDSWRTWCANNKDEACQK